MDSQKCCDSCPYFSAVDYGNRFICMCKKENKLINVEPKNIEPAEHRCCTPSWCGDRDLK